MPYLASDGVTIKDHTWNELELGSIAVNKDHAWYWGDYGIYLWVYNTADFIFYDESGDHYALSVDAIGEGPPSKFQAHRVSYKSDKPNITTIQWSNIGPYGRY